MLSEPGGEEAERESEPVTTGQGCRAVAGLVPPLGLHPGGRSAPGRPGRIRLRHRPVRPRHRSDLPSCVPVRHQIGLFLADIDLFLIGATLLITAIGFYELFIRQIHLNGPTRIPGWLDMRDLNDLKARVIAMIVMVVSVTFVEVVVDSPSGEQVLEFRRWDRSRGGGIDHLFALRPATQSLRAGRARAKKATTREWGARRLLEGLEQGTRTDRCSRGSSQKAHRKRTSFSKPRSRW